MKIVTVIELTLIVIKTIIERLDKNRLKARWFTMELIIGLAYVVLSYWAAGQTIYANKIRIGRITDLFLNRLILGVLLGVVLIPIALIKKTFIHN